LSFFGIDTKPAKMFQAKFRGAFWFMFGELRKVIVKALDCAAVEACPECRFANRFASGQRHTFVIIRRAADHVSMWFDVSHGIKFQKSFAASIPVGFHIQPATS